MAIPSTTPRQVTSHGRSPPPCIAQLASRERAALGVVGVDGGERAAVSGVEGLQQVGRFAAAHFADDDVIGSVPQGVAHEVADTDGSLLQPARLEPDAVRGVDPQLQGVLDGDDPLVVGDELDERVEQRRLAAPGAAAHEDIPAGVQHPLGLVADVRGQRALCDQLRRRKGSFAEPPHGDRDVTGWPAGRRWPRASRRPGAHRGSASWPGPGPRGRAIWIAARSSAAASSAGASIGRCRPWPSSHTLPGPLIMISLTSGIVERGLQPGQERFQQVQPVAGHSWPVRFACQYGRSAGR